MVMDIIEHIKMKAETLDNLEEEEPDFFAVSYLLNFLDILQEKQLLNLPESKELQKKVLKYAGKLAPFVKGPPNGETANITSSNTQFTPLPNIFYKNLKNPPKFPVKFYKKN